MVRGLRLGEKLTKISDSEEGLNFSFRPASVVATILTGDKRVVYKSPGFNLEVYLQEQALRDRERKRKKMKEKKGH